MTEAPRGKRALHSSSTDAREKQIVVNELVAKIIAVMYWLNEEGNNHGYDLAPIIIDDAALLYQASDLKPFGRLTFLRSLPLAFSSWQFGNS